MYVDTALRVEYINFQTNGIVNALEDGTERDFGTIESHDFSQENN